MSRKLLLAVTVGIASLTTLAVAQNQPEGGRGERQGREGREGRGGEGRGNPEEWQRRQAERLKEELKVPDDEWAVIQPKIDAVAKAQRESRIGGFGGRGPGGGGPGGRGPGGGEPPTELARAARDLRQTLESENASAETIAAKLQAVREARTKAEEALQAAREDLKSVLSERQEAILVVAGMLE